MRMKTPLAVTGILILLSMALAAQTATHKAARPAAAGPTKVTGDGTTTASGLQYWDIKPGTGEEAKDGSKVQVHYTGWLTSGKKFDSSVGGPPFDFTIGKNEVIKG